MVRNENEKFKKYLAELIKNGKERDFLKKMIPFQLCQRQMGNWLSEYFFLLPKSKPDLFLKIFSPAHYNDSYVDKVVNTKDFSSVYEKIYNGELNENEIFEKIHDLSRGRVICTYLSQALFISKHLVNEFLIKLKGCKLRENGKRNYIETAKASGYRSINIYLDVPVTSMGFSGMVCFELQIRTELQHTWAEREHKLMYKNMHFQQLPSILKQPKENKRFALAESLYEIDSKFDELRIEVFHNINSHFGQ